MIVPAFGITGGIRSGDWYFGTDNGSRVPPGIGSADAPGTIEARRMKIATVVFGRENLGCDTT
jgi:hypothetical protein